MKIVRPTAITDAILVSSNVLENDYAAYSGATTYAAGDHVISTVTHRVYESLQAGNVGHDLPVSPETATDWWQDVGATNRWRMFDGGVSVQSEQADSIEVVLTPGGIDSVALLNIDAQAYRVTLTENADSPTNIVYDSGEVSLSLESNISDWYQYFFEPVAIRKSDLVLTDIPQYVNGILTITLLSPTATARLGELVVGTYRDLGDTQWAPRISIDDYSVKTRDPFGNFSVLERAFSKRIVVDVFLENASVDETVRTLANYRATLVVWVGSEEFSSMIVFGFYRSFDVVVQSPGGSFCNLEIEGIT